ncbi:sensor histidine kinase [Trebonia kvetii]|uniref:histidine kinase n=2 Tax=Trebonia kvetii TaxID=2480626 RepID=A0A6P2BPM0_9ACTN|nr:sensor histidine kinase [Trebonia kvetii]
MRIQPAVWAAVMAVLCAATIAGHVGDESAAYLALDIAIGVVSIALVPLLARWLVPVALLLSFLAVLSPAATPPATLAVLLVARWRPLGTAAAVAGAGVAAHLIQGAWRSLGSLPYGWWAVLTVVAYAALVGWGTLLRAHTELVASLRERAEHAEAEQARRVAEARAGERARIAREMHDVLAHRLSLLATYAGALSYRPDAPPEQLSRAAEVIRSGTHQALDELREVIGVLRAEETGDPTAGGRPLPGMADLDRLIEESRGAGTPVEVHDGGLDFLAVPDPVGRTVYRVVQEGLTNARKHAPGSAVEVTLGGGPGSGLDVSIANRVPAAGSSVASAPGAASVPGTGTGLIGLAERLDLAGGTLEHRRDAGEFLLHASLPWPE